MAKKAKWLEEGSNLDLVKVIEAGLAEGASDKEAAKVSKAVAELVERFEAEQAEPSVFGNIDIIQKAAGEIIHFAEQAKELYNADIEAAGASTDVVDDTEDDMEDEEPAPKKEKKSKKDKKSKKSKKAPKVEDEEDSVDEEDSEEETIALEDLTKKELKALAKEAGFKVNKGASKEDLIALLSEN